VSGQRKRPPWEQCPDGLSAELPDSPGVALARGVGALTVRHLDVLISLTGRLPAAPKPKF
jgi:hypothetical protein